MLQTKHFNFLLYLTSTLLVLGSFFISNDNLNAQPIIVNEATPYFDPQTGETLTAPEYLASILAGDGVTIENASITGSFESIGFFETHPDNPTPANFDIDFGVVMTSGLLENVPGPSTGNGTGSAVGTPNDGDADMDSDPIICGGTPCTNDACVLEFDITPIGDQLSFAYIFASEEFPEYVCCSVNDAFAFYISGPNPDGGPDFDNVNMALIPDTDIPVEINSVNPGVAGNFCSASDCNSLDYAEYYNSGIPELEYDGLLDLLVAESAVIPCETYHLKLVIADVGDSVFDSAVFLEWGSLTSPAPDLGLSGGFETFVVNPFTGELEAEFTDSDGNNNGVIVEGCRGKEITFSVANLDFGDDVTIDLEINGGVGDNFATNGIDFYDENVNPFPTSITLTGGNPDTTLTISAPQDFENENIEYIVITILGLNSVNCVLNVEEVTDTIRIIDDLLSTIILPPTATPATPNPDPCTGLQFVNLDFLFGDVDSSFWLPEAPILAANGDPTVYSTLAVIDEETTFSLVLYNGPCVDTIETPPIAYNAPQLPDPPVIPTTYPICVVDQTVTLQASGGINYVWSPDSLLSCTECPNPVYTPDGNNITYQATANYSNGCFLDSVYTVNIVFDNVPFLSGPTETVVLCVDEDQEISVIGGEPTSYQWTPDFGLSCDNCPNPIVSPTESTTYMVTAQLAGCDDSWEVNVQVGSSFANAGETLNNCLDVVDYEIGPSEVLEDFIYTWSPVDGLDNPNIANPKVNLSTGQSQTYTLTVESPEACIAFDEVSVTAHALPTVSIAQDSVLIVQGSLTTLTATGISEVDGGTYEWSPIDGLANPYTGITSARPLFSTTYYVVGKTVHGCEAIDSVFVEVIEPPRVLLPNAFSPNGDDLNDIFRPFTKDVAEISGFQVYNRWGETVYDGVYNNFEGWDGLHKGEVQDVGVYIYLIQYRFEGAEETKTVIGNITLIR